MRGVDVGFTDVETDELVEPEAHAAEAEIDGARRDLAQRSIESRAERGLGPRATHVLVVAAKDSFGSEHVIRVGDDERARPAEACVGEARVLVGRGGEVLDA